MIHLLLIDDDSLLRDTLRDRLRADGYEVTVTTNPFDALGIYGAMPTDLVITDIYTPEFDNLVTIGALRKISADLRVIAISQGVGVKGRAFLRTARSYGVARIFTTPVQLVDLLTAINELLEPGSARDT